MARWELCLPVDGIARHRTLPPKRFRTHGAAIFVPERPHCNFNEIPKRAQCRLSSHELFARTMEENVHDFSCGGERCQTSGSVLRGGCHQVASRSKMSSQFP